MGRLVGQRTLWIIAAVLVAVMGVIVWRHVQAQRFILLVGQLRSQDEAERNAAIVQFAENRTLLVRLIGKLDNAVEHSLVVPALACSGRRGAVLLASVIERDEFINVIAANGAAAYVSQPVGQVWAEAPDAFRGAWHSLAAMGGPAIPALTGMLDSPQEGARATACRLMGVIADPAALDALSKAAADPSPLVRWSAAWALGEMRSVDAFEALTRGLQDADGLVRTTALESVASLGEDLPLASVRTNSVYPIEREWEALPLRTLRGTDAVPALSELVFSGSPYERDTAAALLGRIGDPGTFEALMEGMEHPGPAVRAAVIRALAAMGERRALERVIEALDDVTVDVRKAAAEYLKDVRDPSALGPLLEMLRNDRIENARSYAAWAIDYYEEEEALQALLAAASDPSAMVRRTVIHGLGHRSDEASAAAVLRAVHDRDYQVRVMALGRLNEFPKPGGLEAAISALDDPFDEVRECAIRFLGTAKDPRALEPLLALLDGDDKDAALRAALALGELGDPRAVDGLIAASKRGPDVAGCAMLALGAFGGPRAVTALSEASERRAYMQNVSYAACGLAMIGTEEALVELHRICPNVDFREVARNYALYIEVGASESRGLLSAALFLHGNAAMAEDLYWCGQHEFERIARHWTERHGLTHPRRAGDSPERPKWEARPGAWVDLMLARLSYPDPAVRVCAAKILGIQLLDHMGEGNAFSPGRVPPHRGGWQGSHIFASERGFFSKRWGFLANNPGGMPLKIATAEAFEPIVTALEATLADHDPAIRGCAAEALGMMRDTAFIDTIAALLEDEDSGVRRHALRGLGHIKHPDTARLLLEYLSDPSPEMRAEAAWFAGYGPVEGAVEPLAGLLDDESPEVRANAAIGLGFLAEAKTVGPLKAALNDADIRVKTMAAWALAKIGTPESLAALDEAAGVRVDTAAERYLTMIARGNERNVVPLVMALAKLDSEEIGKALYFSGHPDLKAAAAAWNTAAGARHALIVHAWDDMPQWGSEKE